MKIKNTQMVSRIFLGVSSLVLSRIVLMLVDDPEGPNLLIVVVLGVFMYVCSYSTYIILSRYIRISPFWSMLLVQVFVATLFYLLMT